MKLSTKLGRVGLSLFLFGLLLATPAGAGSGAPWGYTGSEGPAFWGELDPAYTACKDGKNQSPIDLSRMVESDLPPITMAYKSGGHEIVNNGHTIKVNHQPGSTLTVDGIEFELKQFHFHAPSENTIAGRSFPMEAHLVHADAQGNLAVVALMFTEGEHNAELAKAWGQMPQKAGDTAKLAQMVNATRLLPLDHSYYRFNGSLTTPPCSEGVRWLVMKSYSSAAKAQIDKFAHTLHHPNNRPVQPVNARLVLK